MKNKSAISAFQFDLILPDGFSVLADSSSLTDRANGHSFSISNYAANTVRFISYSGSLKTYSGSSGPLVQVALQTVPQVNPGNYTLFLQNVVLSDVSGSNVVSNIENGQFKLMPDTIYDTIFISLCEGEIYEFGSQKLSSSGDYVETFEASSGADSIVTLHLTVNEVFSDSIQVEICVGKTYEFGSYILTQSGEYTEVFKSKDGCDSTVVLTLTVNPVYNHTYSV